MNAKITLVNEVGKSYYSGMLPGTVSRKFTNKFVVDENFDGNLFFRVVY